MKKANTPSKPKLMKSGNVGGLTQPKFNTSKTRTHTEAELQSGRKAAPQAPLGATAI